MIKKCLLACLATLSLIAPAHAEIHTFQYTATVREVQSEASPADPAAHHPLLQNPVVVGDKVTGTFSYDDGVPMIFDTSGDVTYAVYGAYEDASSSVRYDRSGFNETAAATSLLASSFIDPTRGGASVQIHAIQSNRDFGRLYISDLELVFTDTDGAMLDEGLLTQYSFERALHATFYQAFWIDGHALLFQGDISSITLLSPVPEASTTAMLLAGLAILALRRRQV